MNVLVLAVIGLKASFIFTWTQNASFQWTNIQMFGPNHQDKMLAAHIYTYKVDICTKRGWSHLHHVITSWLPHQEAEEMEVVVSQPTRLLNRNFNDCYETRWSFHPRCICGNQNRLFVTGSWTSPSVIVTTKTDILIWPKIFSKQ